MCVPWYECDEFHEGAAVSVRAIRMGPRRTPARLFINALDRGARVRTWTEIEWVAENGPHAARCKTERGELYAIEGPGRVRLPYVVRGGSLLITHGVMKVGQGWPAGAFDRADELVRKHDHEEAHEAEDT